MIVVLAPGTLLTRFDLANNPGNFSVYTGQLLCHHLIGQASISPQGDTLILERL
ncbi:hypothetical protein D9M71_658380 [compost metagenome]